MSKLKKGAEKKGSSQTQVLEQTLQYEKKIYDLEQLLDIAKSFCQNLDFGNLLESIVHRHPVWRTVRDHTRCPFHGADSSAGWSEDACSPGGMELCRMMDQ